MDDRITNSVIEKNHDHNLKSSQELLLIDKQGVLYLTPNRTAKKKPTRPRFSRTYDLFGIALVFKDFITNYHSFRLYNEDFADFLLNKIRPWIDEPDIVFGASVSNKYRWELLLEEFGLKARLRFILTQTIINALHEKSQYFDKFAVEWWSQSDFPFLISGEIRESKEIHLGFLENEDLKQLIIEDYAEARRSLQSKNYKATILLCGSIAEAILTAIIDKADLSGITTSKLYSNYDLFKLVDLAKTEGLIRDKTLFPLLEPLRSYRNIIHPGVQVRKSLSPDSSKARIALETVNLLVKDLNRTK